MSAVMVMRMATLLILISRFFISLLLISFSFPVLISYHFNYYNAILFSVLFCIGKALSLFFEKIFLHILILYKF